jgi:hypothetical protein
MTCMFEISRHCFKRIAVPEWDRWTIYLLWCLKLKIDRAWLDDRQYNPWFWPRVLLWRRRHPIWVNRIGCRIDRLMIDMKLGIFLLSRTHGERGVEIYTTKAYRRAQDWARNQR